MNTAGSFEANNANAGQAGTFEANKANAGQAGTVSAAATQGLLKVWWHSVAVLLPLPFVLEDGTAWFFQGRNNIFNGEMPNVTVLISGGA